MARVLLRRELLLQRRESHVSISTMDATSVFRSYNMNRIHSTMPAKAVFAAKVEKLKADKFKQSEQMNPLGAPQPKQC
ncbi:unnamed protein product [Urochloa humidicola]